MMDERPNEPVPVVPEMASHHIAVEENVVAGLKAVHERLPDRFVGVSEATLDVVHDIAVNVLSLDEHELRDRSASPGAGRDPHLR